MYDALLMFGEFDGYWLKVENPHNLLRLVSKIPPTAEQWLRHGPPVATYVLHADFIKEKGVLIYVVEERGRAAGFTTDDMIMRLVDGYRPLQPRVTM